VRVDPNARKKPNHTNPHHLGWFGFRFFLAEWYGLAWVLGFGLGLANGVGWFGFWFGFRKWCRLVWVLVWLKKNGLGWFGLLNLAETHTSKFS